jgi:hypothetical protein
VASCVDAFDKLAILPDGRLRDRDLQLWLRSYFSLVSRQELPLEGGWRIVIQIPGAAPDLEWKWLDEARYKITEIGGIRRTFFMGRRFDHSKILVDRLRALVRDAAPRPC